MKGRAVVKVGTSSVTAEHGELDLVALSKLADELVQAKAAGYDVVLVLSGAIAAGLPALGFKERPADIRTLQAIAAVGQPMLMEQLRSLLAVHGVVPGQVLLDPYDFGQRSQYLHARETLVRLLELGVIPVVNENDTVADDEIRYGDNDRIAALVANMIGAETLVLLTDTDGLYTADPRLDANASLIEEIVSVDAELEAVAGGAGSKRGSGGMASKLAAAKIASWSGVRTVIAATSTPGVIAAALAGSGIGTTILPRAERLSGRKLWIAFARPATGRIVVDAGAVAALSDGGRSLLAAGVREVVGEFEAEAAVEIAGPDGRIFAKGLTRLSAGGIRATAGMQSRDLPDGAPGEVIHCDDLVVIPDS